MATLPQILIAGPSIASDLADVICGTPGGTTWVIDNKYYSCEVSLAVHLLPATAPAAAACGAEALILVVDASRQQSFQAACEWVAAVDIEAVEVRLLVASGVDQLLSAAAGSGHSDGGDNGDGDVEVPKPPWLLSAIDWAAGNGFEYIETCTSDAALDRRLRLDGDVQGVQRISEALGAHMWPNLTPKQPPQPSSSRQAAGGLSSSQAADDDEDAMAGEAAPLQRGDASHVDGATSSASPDGAQEASLQGESPRDAGGTAGGSGRQQPDANGAGAAMADTAAPTANGGSGRPAAAHQPPHPPLPAAAAPGGDDAELTEELEAQHLGVDAFDKLMTDMSRARERVATLPDAERRQAAAALAMRFAAMMGDDTDEEGGDSDTSD